MKPNTCSECGDLSCVCRETFLGEWLCPDCWGDYECDLEVCCGCGCDVPESQCLPTTEGMLCSRCYDPEQYVDDISEEEIRAAQTREIERMP